MYEDKRTCDNCGNENHLLINELNYAWKCYWCYQPYWLGDIERISASIVLDCPIYKIDNKLEALTNVETPLFWAESSPSE